MKRILLTTVIALLFVGLLANMASAAPAQKQLLFKGSWDTVENDQVDLPSILVDGNGGGKATDLGLYMVHYEGIVYNNPDGVGTAVLAAHFVAANGDILFLSGTGLGTPTVIPGINHIVEKYTITGGTGRFVDASGNITVDRMLNLATGVSAGTVQGTIFLP